MRKQPTGERPGSKPPPLPAPPVLEDREDAEKSPNRFGVVGRPNGGVALTGLGLIASVQNSEGGLSAYDALNLAAWLVATSVASASVEERRATLVRFKRLTLGAMS